MGRCWRKGGEGKEQIKRPDVRMKISEEKKKNQTGGFANTEDERNVFVKSRRATKEKGKGSKTEKKKKINTEWGV